VWNNTGFANTNVAATRENVTPTLLCLFY
jgi:hypothetical protein